METVVGCVLDILARSTRRSVELQCDTPSVDPIQVAFQSLGVDFR
jgi:hypothetical protein